PPHPSPPGPRANPEVRAGRAAGVALLPGSFDNPSRGAASCRKSAAWGKDQGARTTGMTDHAETTIQRILASETFRCAAGVLAAQHDRTVEDIIRLTEIESPSFNEAVRARTWFDMARTHG